MALVQLIGGNFQDSEGNVLNSGYLTMTLSHDEQDPSSGTQIAAGLPVKILLDNMGSVAGIQKVWATDVLLPTGAYYIVEAFKSDGTSAWGSTQFVTVPSGSTFNIGSFIPSQPVPQPLPQTITLQTNGATNSVQNLENLVAGANITLVNSAGSTTITGLGTGSSVAVNQIRQMWVIGDGSNPVFGIGHGNAPAQTGSFAQTLPTATEMGANNLSAAATASVNTVVGVTGPAAASNGIFTFGTFASLQMRVRFNVISSVRWWLGIGFNKFQSGGGNANYATDTPNTSFVGFRYSATTDTTIKAVCSTSSVNQTVVNTTIVPDTVHSQLFGIAPTSGGYNFYINNVLVATVTTTVPTATTLFSQLVCGDNKNTNTAMNFDFWWSLQTNAPLI